VAALIDVSDIETALGRPAEDDEEEAKWQRYINSLSDYINARVSVSFFPVENGTSRLQADYDGEIQLTGPVTAVTSVKNFRSQQEDQYVDWDGLQTLFNLLPDQVVDVTWSYGYTDVPDDVVNIMITGVLAAVDEGSPLDMRAYKVGDVDEQYRQSTISNYFGDGLKAVLGKYGDNGFSIGTSDGGHYPDYQSRGFVNG